MYFVDRSAVVLKPTQVFLDWLKSVDEDMPELSLAQIRSTCTVLLIPEVGEPEEAVAYLDERFEEVFRNELSGWEVPQDLWPKSMDLVTFWQFFEVEIHDLVLDSVDDELMVQPISS